MSRERRFLRDDILEDMVTLCNGFGKHFKNRMPQWNDMTLEEKKDWCENFAREHAHPVQVPDESDCNREYRMRQQIIEPGLWDFGRPTGVPIRVPTIEKCTKQLLLTGREKQTLLGCISIAIEEGLYKDCIDEDSVKHILIKLGMNIEDIQKAIYYCSSLNGVV